MAGEQEKFNAQQERVQKLAESYEGAEKKDIVDLYVDRIGKIKTAIMDSSIPDSQKDDYFKRLDSYLNLVDADSIQRLKKEYEPLLKSMESSLNIGLKDQAKEDRDAKLDTVHDPDIRKELLEQWRDANKFKEKFNSKKQQIDLLIKTKKLTVEGTELQWFMTSVEYYNDFITSKFGEYYDAKDVGSKRESLKKITDQGDDFFQVLVELEGRLKNVNSQDDLVVINLNDRSVLAEQAMFVKRKRFEDSKKRFLKRLDELKVPANDMIRTQVAQVFQNADMQFDAQKELAMEAKDPAARTAYAENANKILDNANSILEAEETALKYQDVMHGVEHGMTTGAARTGERLASVGVHLSSMLIPQFAVGLGYWNAMHRGETKTDTALEVADFTLSLVPFVGGVYDMGMAINGRTLSGRKMGTVERIARGVIGAGSLALDIFSFGVGGTAVRVGAEATIKAGVKLTAEATAKAALEASTKAVAKEGIKVGEEALVKGVVETGVKAGEEALGKGATDAALKAGEAGVESATKKVITVSLTEGEKQIILEGTKAGASKVAREGAQKVLKEAIKKSTDAYVATLAKEQTAAFAKYTEKVISETATVATRQSGRINNFLTRVTQGAFRTGGMKGLEEGIIKTGTQKAVMESAVKEGKEIGLGYFVKSEFVKEGEVMFGAMAKQIGKESAKSFLHMHDPRELLKILQTPGKALKYMFRRFVKGAPGQLFATKEALQDMERSAKASLIADGQNAKEVEVLFADVKEKPWEQFLKDNEKNAILEDKDALEFFKNFQEQFPKSGLVQGEMKGMLPTLSLGEETKSMTDLYKSFRETGADRMTSAKMLYDSRRMEWAAFAKKYEKNLVASTEADLKSFEDKFKNLHSLDRAMPANYARIRKQRKDYGDAMKASEEEISKLSSTLRDLTQEKSDMEAVLKSYSESLEVLEKAGTKLTDGERDKILVELFEKLPDGNLKKAVEDFRAPYLKDANLDAKDYRSSVVPGEDVKEGTREFQKYTSDSFQTVIEQRIKDIDERVLAAKADLDAANGVKSEIKNPERPTLDQKKSTEEVATKQGETSKVALERRDVERTIENYKKLLKKKQGEVGTELLSKEQEAEVWFDVYKGLKSETLKQEIDDLRRTALSFPKEGTVEFKQKLGELTKKHVLESKDRVEAVKS